MADFDNEELFRKWWINEEYEGYREKWIAFSRGEISEAFELSDLLREISASPLDVDGPIIAFIGPDGAFQ